MRPSSNKTLLLAILIVQHNIYTSPLFEFRTLVRTIGDLPCETIRQPLDLALDVFGIGMVDCF